MNNQITVNGETLTVKRSKYQSNNSLYIGLFDSDGCPYSNMSVNLEDYGVKLEPNQITVDHNIMHDDVLIAEFVKAFCEIPTDGMFPAVTYGPFDCTSAILTIKDLSLIPEM